MRLVKHLCQFLDFVPIKNKRSKQNKKKIRTNKKKKKKLSWPNFAIVRNGTLRCITGCPQQIEKEYIRAAVAVEVSNVRKKEIEIPIINHLDTKQTDNCSSNCASTLYQEAFYFMKNQTNNFGIVFYVGIENLVD